MWTFNEALAPKNCRMVANIKFINSLFVKQLLEDKFRQTEVVVKKHSIESDSGYVHRLTIRCRPNTSHRNHVKQMLLSCQ